MNDPAIDPPASSTPDVAAVGAALLMSDLHEAVAEVTAQLAALAAAIPPAAGFIVPLQPQAASQPPVLPPDAGGLAWPVQGVERGVPSGWAESASPAADTRAPLWPAPEPASPAALASVGAQLTPPPVPAAPVDAAGTQPAQAVAAGRPASPLAAAFAITPPTFTAAAAKVAATVAAAPAAPASHSSPATRPEGAWSSAGAAAPWQEPSSRPPAAAAAPPMPAAMPSAAPPPRQTAGPTGGDVFLDGIRVGRWLSDTLAREAGGPATGGTGFDPRLGPTWPGALQGNGT